MEIMRSGFFILGLLLFFACQLPAQVELQTRWLDTPVKTISKPQRFADTPALRQQLREQLQEVRLSGYLTASLDSLLPQNDSTYLAVLYRGPLFSWGALDAGSIDPQVLSGAGVRTRSLPGRTFSLAELRKLQEDLLEYAENHGYPFARLEVDSVAIDQQGRVVARLRLTEGPLVTMDTLAIRGNVQIRPYYLQNYLGIQAGTPYDRESILRTRQRLRELPFLQLKKDPEIAFLPNHQARLQVDLEKKRSSRFDFLIGVLPNSGSTGNLQITGTLTGELQNQFGAGERIYVFFEQLRPETQQLEVDFQYPYLLSLPFGADLEFAIYKRDSTFVDVNSSLGIQYLFAGGNYLNVFWKNKNSNLLAVDTAAVRAQQALPENLDVRYTSFGLELVQEFLDYRLNPRKGWRFQASGAAGNKIVRRNNDIENAGLGFLYDTLTEKSIQYQLQGNVEYFLGLGQRATLKTGLRSGWLLSDGDIYQNEQFRLGGNQLLRGFDEDFFLATGYVLGTLEYRLLLGQNSYLFTFLDYGWLKDKTATTHQTVQPYGFGTGISFETSAGIFGLNLAVGALRGEPVDFSSPKVHFGYLSLF